MYPSSLLPIATLTDFTYVGILTLPVDTILDFLENDPRPESVRLHNFDWVGIRINPGLPPRNLLPDVLLLRPLKSTNATRNVHSVWLVVI